MPTSTCITWRRPKAPPEVFSPPGRCDRPRLAYTPPPGSPPTHAPISRHRPDDPRRAAQRVERSGGVRERAMGVADGASTAPWCSSRTSLASRWSPDANKAPGQGHGCPRVGRAGQPHVAAPAALGARSVARARDVQRPEPAGMPRRPPEHPATSKLERGLGARGGCLHRSAGRSSFGAVGLVWPAFVDRAPPMACGRLPWRPPAA